MTALLALLMACGGDPDAKDSGPGTTPPLTWVGELHSFCDMTELGRVQMPGEYTTDVVVVDDLAYATWGGNDDVQGLEVVDLSDPTAPTIVGHADTADYWPIRISAAPDGSHLFVAHQWSGVLIYDLATPTSPFLVGTVTVEPDPTYGFSQRSTDAAFDGQHVYIVGTHLAIYDVADPTNPVQVGRLAPPWEEVPDDQRFTNLTETITLSGDHALITDLDGHLTVVDISDPAAPTKVSQARWVGQARNAVTDGSTAFLTDLYLGVRAADLSDPANPVALDSTNTSGEPYTSALDGDRLYVADNLNGILSFDVSDPNNLEWVGYHPVDEGTGAGPVGSLNGDGPWGLWVQDGRIVAATTKDLRVVKDCTIGA